ncbi:MAG: hypothetical protein ACFFER_05020 [Candidatus Thorarchaeota archaeon]
MSSTRAHHKERVPNSSKLIIESCDYALRKHRMLGLFEADVTEARKTLHNHKEKTGESISFTGWIAACVGKAVAVHKQVHALMIGRHFVIFDDVNINILIETTIEGRPYPVNYILKSANEKTVVEIAISDNHLPS